MIDKKKVGIEQGMLAKTLLGMQAKNEGVTLKS